MKDHSVATRASESALILICGRHTPILESRRLVLEQAGFQVHLSMESSDTRKFIATHLYDVLLLYHSLPLEEAEEVLKISRAHRPAMKNLMLTASTPLPTLTPDDEVLSAFEGPRTLIETVRLLIGKRPSPLHPGTASPLASSPHVGQATAKTASTPHLD